MSRWICCALAAVLVQHQCVPARANRAIRRRWPQHHEGPGISTMGFLRDQEHPHPRENECAISRRVFQYFQQREFPASQQRHQFSKFRPNCGCSTRAYRAVGAQVRFLVRSMSLAGASQSAVGVKSAELASDLEESDVAYHGWRVVLAASLGVMGGFGSLFVYTFAVFVKPLSAQFGWSREQISTGFAIAAVTLGVVSPFLGRWLDRFTPRRIILVCVTVFGCAIASLSLLQGTVWQFYATCLVLGVVGNGAAHLAYSRSISTWFR